MNPKDVVRRGYDAASAHYRADDECLPRYESWLRELSAELTPGARILDLGCGCGLPAARWLLDHGFGVTGVDISPVQIERAKNLVPEATLLCADIMDAPFPNASFDAALALYSVIHLPLAEQPRLFDLVKIWLSPGGLLLATVGASEWTGMESNWLGSGADMYWSHADRDTYVRFITEAGFHVLWTRFVPEGTGGHTLVLARREM